MPENPMSQVGFWSALATCCFSSAYALRQLVIGIDMPRR